MYFVDSNILIDILSENPTRVEASAGLIDDCALEGPIIINHIVFAEISVPFTRIEHCVESLSHLALELETMPLEAAFMAGKIYQQYRKAGGTKNNVLPDFFIGAHAAIAGHTLLTRDTSRYQTYFPTLKILLP